MGSRFRGPCVGTKTVKDRIGESPSTIRGCEPRKDMEVSEN